MEHGIFHYVTLNVTETSPDNLFDIASIKVTLSFVIVVDGINDVFFAVFNDFPHCATDHVTSWNRCDGQPLSLPLQMNGLT